MRHPLLAGCVMLLLLGCEQQNTPGSGSGSGSSTISGPGSGSASSPPSATTANPPKDHHHHGPGPHDGTVFDFGTLHAELVINHDKQECIVYILAANEKDPFPVRCKELTLTTKPTKTARGVEVPALTIRLRPGEEINGKASWFAGTDPGLAHVANFSGTLVGEVDGKPMQGRFEEK